MIYQYNNKDRNKRAKREHQHTQTTNLVAETTEIVTRTKDKQHNNLRQQKSVKQNTAKAPPFNVIKSMQKTTMSNNANLQRKSS